MTPSPPDGSTPGPWPACGPPRLRRRLLRPHEAETASSSRASSKHPSARRRAPLCLAAADPRPGSWPHPRRPAYSPGTRPPGVGPRSPEYLAIASANRRSPPTESRAELDTYVAEVAPVGSAVGSSTRPAPGPARRRLPPQPRPWPSASRPPPPSATWRTRRSSPQWPVRRGGRCGRIAGLPPPLGRRCCAPPSRLPRGGGLPGPRPGRRPPPREPLPLKAAAGASPADLYAVGAFLGFPTAGRSKNSSNA